MPALACRSAIVSKIAVYPGRKKRPLHSAPPTSPMRKSGNWFHGHRRKQRRAPHGGFRQRRKGLFAGLENDDAGLGSRVAGYFRGLHRRQAALRRGCRPSLTSSMILALKASRSPGLREVMTPWSTTTSESSHFAPALARSVLIDL